MGVILEELVKQIDPRNIKIVAGKDGMSNMVEWSHMVETVEIAGFLNGGEVAFTTGIGINEDNTLMDLVTAVYKQNGSGIVINIGPYIKEIGHEIIEFANNNNFPVFEVPWKVHMADIMRLFCGTITRSEQRTMEITAAFKNAIFSPRMEELYVPVLMQKGYFSEWNYVVGVIDICNRIWKNDTSYAYVPMSAERFLLLRKNIERILKEIKYDAVVYPDQEKLLIIFSDMNELGVHKIMEQITEQISNYMKEDEVVFSSVGNTVKQIREIYRSYIVAHRIAELLKIDGDEYMCKTYSQMGIAKMLLNLKSLECLDEYYADTIQPLDEYDEANGSNLVETLINYTEHNGSVQDTATDMYVHRNTVNYKLKKIESILDVELIDFEVRNMLMTGLIVRKMRRLK